ncbi:precorrin-2 dehydrogenase/sirohydrochlorin ferrochelatase family protein [Pseudoramibacter sp.]|jgi:precorrin-2 dehydrogenase/sirohydrochlorin ferrochelatase|uniref:precorrin-2 dehydrogenase/sirohydrochlorin ferrochelatase family protein n=1 Tax=Pseudoramibacter sp. TaxID=2034862 RepID=UPI0025D8B982|nr:bifunctional precorrin-2 dehydrogenase/sirohydrochlorin ferrochelatase [Pseudoramibacter sp.]MCH4072207.1 bifunctional precorrin-2 dehydrogenase/sirohydrochlorin ferrochelatase [Pseudoramibacter sp.]MCH4105977.1 bifunctional precorrin-2 dehydrogenase/sirohydrochlorin ferrochelatase [Pseudoramibacter sp.]
MKLPILLEFEGREALVVGAGTVGRRRAKALSEAGCRVTVAADEALEDGLLPNCQFVEGRYTEALLAGKSIVVAATNQRAVNAQIVTDCKARGILVNAADDPDHSDFFFPAVIRRGDLTLSVCTEGASPSMTREIAQSLRAAYPESVGERLHYLKILRAQVLKNGQSKAEQRRLLKEMTDWPLEKLRKAAERGA